MILFIVIGGFLVPSFGSFGYYFMLDVVKISKFTYSMLTVLGFMCLFIGTMIYRKYFTEKEYRNLIMMDALISILLAPLSFIFVLRLNVAWGIPDMFLIIFTDVVSEILAQCFVFLPMSVIYAKICPPRIEATAFALLSSVSNFRGTIRGWLGAFINKQWVGVTVDDLSNYWVLVTIGFCCSFLPLFFLWMIPSRKEIEVLQEQIRLDNQAKAEAEAREGKDLEGNIEGEDETSGLLAEKKTARSLNSQDGSSKDGSTMSSSQEGLRNRGTRDAPPLTGQY